jgi:hypothetical protein
MSTDLDFSDKGTSIQYRNVHPADPGQLRLRPLNELCRSNPSEVISRYSTSAKKCWFHPSGLGLSDRLCEFRFWAEHRIELSSDLARNSPRPACPDLAHVHQVFPFPLSQIKSCNPGRISHKANDREDTFLNGFYFQPTLRGRQRCRASSSRNSRP